MNLFSSFDPQVLTLNILWVSSLFPLAFYVMNFWVSASELHKSLDLFKKALLSELNTLFVPSKILPLWSIFWTLLLTNFFGLFPYIFTSSTHLIFGLSLGLPLWVGHMGISYFKQPLFMLAHLLPSGTPLALQPFMVLIEVISTVIRPLTLSIRLMANMMAGHLLLTLLGAMGSSGAMIFGMLVGMSCILILELGVALIQAYVFVILSSLYLSEVNSIKINKLN